MIGKIGLQEQTAMSEFSVSIGPGEDLRGLKEMCFLNAHLIGKNFYAVKS